MTEGIQRKLAAIVSADVVGYSRLMGVDEVGTLAALRNHRAELIDGKIAEHGGRIVKTMGDGLLLEFPSVVDAAQCMIDVQQAMAVRNEAVDEDKRIVFRIGVHLGDVIVEGNDIFGDGVNIAARLQEIGEAEGVTLSGDAHNSVGGRVDAEFADDGDQELKNIARPVRVWRWSPDQQTPAETIVAGPDESLPLPDKPSIAVLPFDNMSGDPEQEYFSDGIAEDLLTSLSHIHELLVIARNSSFSYKGQNPDVRQVARDLGVHYVLEGSVRSAGARVRITAQLIDGSDGSHLWAERYDRELTDIFELQDEITSKIANALEVRLTEGQQARIRRDQTASIPAWQLHQQAQYHMRRFTPGDNALAREQAIAALNHDKGFVTALALLAWTYLVETRLPWSPSRDEAMAEGLRVIERAMEITADNSDILAMLGSFKLAQGYHDEAETIQRRAVALGPNIADSRLPLALTLNMRNKPREAARLINEAMRLCPIFPDFYLGILAISYRLLKRYDDAIDADHKRLGMNPNNAFSDIRLAAVYAEIGEIELARQHVEEALKKQPMYRIIHLSQTDGYEDPELMRQYENLLRKAGLPE